MSHWLDEEPFYELMQAYRCAPAEEQQKAAEAIKSAIRRRLEQRSGREFVLVLLLNKFKDATMDMKSHQVEEAHDTARRLGL